MLKNMKIGAKLIGGYLIVAAILVVMALLSHSSMKTLNENTKTMYQERLKPLTGLNAAYTMFYFIRGDLYKYIVTPQKERERLLQETNDKFATIEKDMDLYRQKNLTINCISLTQRSCQINFS